MTATGDVTDRIVPETRDLIKTTYGWPRGVLEGQTTAPPSYPTRDTVYHSVRIWFEPRAWMLFFVILPMTFMLVPPRRKARQMLQQPCERIESVGLPGLLTLKFRRRQARESQSQRSAKSKEAGQTQARAEWRQQNINSIIGRHRSDTRTLEWMS